MPITTGKKWAGDVTSKPFMELPCHHVASLFLVLAVGMAGGCRSSNGSRPLSSPAATGPYANAYPAGIATDPQAGQFSQAMRPTTQAGLPADGGQVGAPEIVATPRPDVAPSGPPGMPGQPPGPPGPVLGPLPRPVKRVPKWRGFLPAHGTDEDRPGWWTPDYGGGTSA